MAKSKRKKIAVDFDKTLSMGRFPACGPPNKPLIELLKKMMEPPVEKRDIFILWTCRKGEALDSAIQWLKSQGIVFDAVNKIPKEFQDEFSDSGSRKINADIFIDDKAITANQFCEKHNKPVPKYSRACYTYKFRPLKQGGAFNS
jgi:hypothetical protein